MSLRLGHCRVCNVEDFLDPELQEAMHQVYGVPIAPPGREDRKYWEVGMASRSLQAFGAVRADAEILGVGAGHEATMFHLTRLVRRVFATDLYLDPADWERTAPTSVLADPGRYWGGPWEPRRLVVQHMDALDLRYEDGVFDGIFSSSSIEHFGDHEAVRRAAAEMCRVLKHGGVCSVSTELKLKGDGPGFSDTNLFTVEELLDLFLTGNDWELVEPLDTTLSPITLSRMVDFEEAAEDVRAGRPSWRTYPHIVMRFGGYVWTSVHLALRRA